MRKLLSILLMLSAPTAQASVQSFKPDDRATLHPVSIVTAQREEGLKPSCKPVALFLRFPDGRIMLVGIVRPRAAC
jgi:hypothetical protein